MSEATPTPSLLLDDECNLINKNKKESVLKVFENVPSGKRTLHTPGLAISCSLVLILSLMLAAIVTSNPVTSNPNVDIAVRVVWFFFTFIFLLYPLRLFVSNILCLVFKSNRDAMLGRPINTKTYRNVKTGSKASPDDTVTFMIPVFTESFDVIRETIFSAIAEARRTEAKVNVLVCDDSLMFYAENNPLRPTYNSAKNTSENKRTHNQQMMVERLEFYDSLQDAEGVTFGYVARPWPVAGVAQTSRNGTFKKAGNLNFTHELADRLASHDDQGRFSIEQTLENMLGEHAEKAYADGTIRVGDFIVLLDKDSIVAEGSLDEVVPEFHSDDSLVFAQFTNTSVNEHDSHFSLVTSYFFEQEHSMKYPMEAVNGSVSFVGHNAILSTRHLRLNGYWNEEYVSEDLNLSMEVTALGYHGKLIDIPNMKYGEYVPTTLTEEIQRYSRYSYGAAQILFNPLKSWFKEGPVRAKLLQYFRSEHLAWPVKLDVLIHLTGFIGMTLLVPILALSVFEPSIIMQIHLASIVFFFLASLIKVIPSAFMCVDKVGKDKGIFLTILRYMLYTVPKLFVDLSVSFAVSRGFMAYLAGKKPDHAPTAVGKFSATSIFAGFKLVKHTLSTLLGFLTIIVLMATLFHISGVQHFALFTYLNLVLLMLVISPFLFTPEFNVALLRNLKIARK